MIFGIIGTGEADEEMVAAGLSDLRDAAHADDGVFWGIVALNSESPEAVGHAIGWMMENEVAFDLVIAPDIYDSVPDEWVQASDGTVKIKDTDKKVVDRLIKEDGTHLLVLAGDTEPSEEVQALAQRAYDGDIKVHDLADGAREIEFGPDVEDETTETGDEGIDFAALGTAAEDEDDTDAQEKLTELGTEAGIDEDEMNEMSWTELAERLSDLASIDEGDGSAEDVPATPAKKGSSKAPAASKANLWTEEALRAKSIKELRVIAAQADIAGAGKMGLEPLIKALQGKPSNVEAEPEEETTEEVAEAPKKGRAPAKSKAAADVEESDLDAIALSIGRAVINALKALSS